MDRHRMLGRCTVKGTREEEVDMSLSYWGVVTVEVRQEVEDGPVTHSLGTHYSLYTWESYWIVMYLEISLGREVTYNRLHTTIM